MAEEHQKRATIAAGLAVALLAALVYAPSLAHGFLVGDDEYNFVHNPYWRGFTAENLRWMWTRPHNGHFHPLTWMSFALDHELAGGSSTRWMHATGLGLHALASVLVFVLIRRLWHLGGGHAAGTSLDLAAVSGAALFAVHPLRVESVVWLTERRDALSCVFLLIAVLAWLRRRAGGGVGWLAAALCAYAASLLSKAWGITLPALLLLLDVWPLRRRMSAALVWQKGPFFALAAGAAALAVWAQSSLEAMSSWADHGLVQRCAQAAYGLAFYLAKTLAPVRLSHLYLLERGFDPLAPVHLAAAVAVVALTFALWRLRRRCPAALAAWAAYALVLAPVLGFAQSGWQKVADRYAYLAVVPLAALLAAALVPAFERARTRTLAFVATACALCAVLTWRQVHVFRDSESVWGRAVALDPGNYVALHNLSLALHAQSRWEEAIQRELRAAELHPPPNRELVLDHLGMLFAKRGAPGDPERARAAWGEAIELRPRREAVQRLAWSFRESGEPARAEGMLREVLARAERARDFTWAHEELAGLYASQGRTVEALAEWQAGTTRDPDWARGHFAAGSILLAAGEPARAESALSEAARLAPTADHLTQLAACWIELGRPEEARAALLRALAREPDHDHARGLLAQLSGA